MVDIEAPDVRTVEARHGAKWPPRERETEHAPGSAARGAAKMWHAFSGKKWKEDVHTRVLCWLQPGPVTFYMC
jgi:hypothetical protein